MPLLMPDDFRRRHYFDDITPLQPDTAATLSAMLLTHATRHAAAIIYAMPAPPLMLRHFVDANACRPPSLLRCAIDYAIAVIRHPEYFPLFR